MSVDRWDHYGDAEEPRQVRLRHLHVDHRRGARRPRVAEVSAAVRVILVRVQKHVHVCAGRSAELCVVRGRDRQWRALDSGVLLHGFLNRRVVTTRELECRAPGESRGVGLQLEVALVDVPVPDVDDEPNDEDQRAD